MATTIHHTTKKSAEKQGIMLEVDGAIVRAYIPANGMLAFGVSGQDAVKQVLAAQDIFNKSSENVRYRVGEEFKQRGYLEKNGKTGDAEPSITTGTPVELLKLWEDGVIDWNDGTIVDNIEDTFEMHSPSAGEPGYREPIDGANAHGIGPDTDGGPNPYFVEDKHPKDPAPDSRPVVARSENGVALDGGIAYREGITAADCPFSSETDDDEEYARFEKWNEEWDAAADEATDEEEGSKGGSVVSSKYRTRYAEMGHPTHCGDWLAELLNNYCIGDRNTDLETAERIFALNGVDTSKYKRDGVGWQGRIRMTGRNLLAKKVFAAGKIIVPIVGEMTSGDGTQTIEAPADWMQAQRYTKPKVE